MEWDRGILGIACRARLNGAQRGPSPRPPLFALLGAVSQATGFCRMPGVELAWWRAARVEGVEVGILDRVKEMNGHAVHVPYTGESSGAMERAEEKLLSMGYEVGERTESTLELKRKGSVITGNPDKMRHTLSIKVTGDDWRFLFSTGLVASLWTEKDIAWAQARAKSVIDAI